jgi:hypothetical protein
VFDDGGGPALYAGGSFTTIGGVAANGIARWNGSRWSALGSGIATGFVTTLAAFDDGLVSALYVGGTFFSAGGVVGTASIARWDGSRWSAVGGGLTNAVYALTVFDDGRGADLYAGGGFSRAGAVAANHVARWDGIAWSALGSGTGDLVRSLVVHDDGSGPALYAGGSFASAGGAPANGVARWNGATWSALGSGVGEGIAPSVASLAVFDAGGGAALYAGGRFKRAGGTVSCGFARWNGARWSSFGDGLTADVLAFAAFDDGTGTAL